jgi:RNA polymerase subunit RPABC4/transcription elongation factor Spt4
MKMPIEESSAIRLEEAYFCLNCEVVTNCLDICPACGHRELWSLENWLGRITDGENSGDKEGALARMGI